MSSSNLPTSFLFEATPNSAKMAEILLQLKDDGISRLVQTSESEIPFPSSQQTVSSFQKFELLTFLKFSNF